MDSLEARELAKIKHIVLQHMLPYRSAKVYLFGSRATGSARRMSDVDIGIANTREIPRVTFSNIREALEESDIVLPVEIVNLDETDESFRTRAIDAGVLWNDSANESR